MSVVVVAIPAKDDPVWTLSSEKVPHMTLLFLGDMPAPAIERVQSYMARMVAPKIPPFWLGVTKRDSLGPDGADVVFLDGPNLFNLHNLRRSMLENFDIASAYHNADQFPTWTPHLTLGYPESPAKPDKRQYPGVYSIYFDRLALWTADSEGTTFELNSNRMEEADMADAESDLEHADVQNGIVGSFLARYGVDESRELKHYGIKGMRWGRRRTDAELGNDSGEGKPGDGASSRATKKADAGTTGVTETSTGRITTVKKKDDGGWEETFLSADAERFLKTRAKDGHEMSDREMREAINRAKSIDEYNKLFDDGPGGQLKRQVEQLRLQKEFATLQAEMNPSRIQRVNSLIENASSAYTKFQGIDEQAGGLLSAQIRKGLGLPDPKPSIADRIKDLTNARDIKKLDKEIADIDSQRNTKKSPQDEAFERMKKQNEAEQVAEQMANRRQKVADDAVKRQREAADYAAKAAERAAKAAKKS